MIKECNSQMLNIQSIIKIIYLLNEIQHINSKEKHSIDMKHWKNASINRIGIISLPNTTKSFRKENSYDISKILGVSSWKTFETTEWWVSITPY